MAKVGRAVIDYAGILFIGVAASGLTLALAPAHQVLPLRPHDRVVVVVESFPTGWMEARGLSPDALIALGLEGTGAHDVHVVIEAMDEPIR